jgi:hypothetical protein
LRQILGFLFYSPVLLTTAKKAFQWYQQFIQIVGFEKASKAFHQLRRQNQWAFISMNLICFKQRAIDIGKK